MTASLVTKLAVEYNSTTPFTYAFSDLSGVGTGPYAAAHAAVDTTGALINPARKEDVLAVATALGATLKTAPQANAPHASTAGVLQNVGDAVTLSVDGFSALGVQLAASAAWTGTVNFLGSMDGGLTYPIPLSMASFGTVVADASSATASGNWEKEAGALTHMRVTAATVITGGPLTATLIATTGVKRVKISGSSASPLPISAASLPLPAGAATDATAQSILSTLQAQRAETLWTDDTNAFFIRIDKAGVISWTDPLGNASTGPGSGARPAAGTSAIVDSSRYQATAAGTGYSVGDYLSHIVTTDPSTGAVIGHFWLDVTTETKLAASPASANITPVAPLPTGAALDSSVQAVKLALGSPFQAGGAIANASFGISGQLPAFAATPTFNLGTAPTLTVQGTLSTFGYAVATAAAPTTYTSGVNNPLSQTLSGQLRTLATTDQSSHGTSDKVAADLYYGGTAAGPGNPITVALNSNAVAPVYFYSATLQSLSTGAFSGYFLDKRAQVKTSPSGSDDPLVGMSPYTTPAAGSSLQLKGSAGNAYSGGVTAGSTAGFLLLLDAAGVPSSGGTIAPKFCMAVAANASWAGSFTGINIPKALANGGVLVFSSAVFTYTPVNAAFICGEMR